MFMEMPLQGNIQTTCKPLGSWDGEIHGRHTYGTRARIIGGGILKVGPEDGREIQTTRQ